MHNDVFGSTQSTVNSEREGASSRVFTKGSTMMEGLIGERRRSMVDGEMMQEGISGVCRQNTGT
jgi:hypothetical protein